MGLGSFKNVIYKMWSKIIYLIYMYGKYLAPNNLFAIKKKKKKKTINPFLWEAHIWSVTSSTMTQ